MDQGHYIKKIKRARRRRPPLDTFKYHVPGSIWVAVDEPEPDPKPKSKRPKPALPTDAYPRQSCIYCGANTVPLTRDHIIPLSLGGRNVSANIAMACGPCNQRKGSFLMDGIEERIPGIPNAVDWDAAIASLHDYFDAVREERRRKREEREQDRIAAGRLRHLGTGFE